MVTKYFNSLYPCVHHVQHNAIVANPSCGQLETKNKYSNISVPAHDPQVRLRATVLGGPVPRQPGHSPADVCTYEVASKIKTKREFLKVRYRDFGEGFVWVQDVKRSGCQNIGSCTNK